jgi:hypothetical protein
MKFIKSNPYRVIGLLSNTSEREIQKQKSKITKYISIGKQVETEYDFPFLGPVNRTEKTLNQAFSAVEQGHEKVSHSLFWFLSVNSFDDAAIGYLTKGDKEKALEIWKKVTDGKELKLNNYSSFNNISTLYLGEKSLSLIKTGIEAKFKLIESPQFIDFVNQVADETISIDSKITIEKFSDDLYCQLITQFSDADILNLFQNTSLIAYSRIKSKITEEPIHKIEVHILNVKNNRKSKPEKSYELGVTLNEDSKIEIETLETILGKDDLKFRMITDNLAKEILQCGVDFFNGSSKTNDDIENALELLNIAKHIASGTQTLERINSNIDAITETKDKEMSSAIEFMKSVKKTYDENKIKIMAEVYLMPLGHNQTINWSKVNGVIDNSIDWNKVVDYLIKIIPPENLNIIKSFQDTNTIEEYKKLLDFLVSKLTYLQVNKIKYLNFWKTEDTLSNIEFTFKSLPTWVKWIAAAAILLLIIWLIWGDDGLETVFGIAGVLGLFFILGWAQNR